MSAELISVQKTDATGDTPQVVAWLEANFGPVLSIELQARWRPMWFAQVNHGGKILDLCVRGDRVDSRQSFPLHHEMLAQRVMYENGIRVPKVYAWIDELGAYVMDRLPGKENFVGLTPEQRDNVMRDYMRELAKLHKIPVELAEAAGVTGAKTPEEASTYVIHKYIQRFRNQKKRPEPFVEFVMAYILRNPPPPHNRRALIPWDSGQLLQENGKFVSIIDVEVAHIGDPMMDLGSLRCRDTHLGFGDMRQLYRWYEEESGTPLDMKAIQHYHLFMSMTNALAFTGAVAEPAPASDYMTNLHWINLTNQIAVEAMGEIMDVTLPQIAIPEAVVTPWAVPFAHFERLLRGFEVDDEVTKYKLRQAFRLTRHLARADEIGRQVVEANLDDIAQLLGTRPATWQEGDEKLEQFVLADKGVHDMELLLLFNKRHQRLQALNGPAGSAIAKHIPVQPFGGSM